MPTITCAQCSAEFDPTPKCPDCRRPVADDEVTPAMAKAGQGVLCSPGLATGSPTDAVDAIYKAMRAARK